MGLSVSKRDGSGAHSHSEPMSFSTSRAVRECLMEFCYKRGMSFSSVINSAVLAYLANPERAAKEMRAEIEIAKFERSRSPKLAYSQMLMAQEGWARSIRRVILNWIGRHRVLPSKQLEKAWLDCGIAYGWSPKKSSQAVRKAILEAKAKFWGEGNSVSMGGKERRIRREIRRQKGAKHEFEGRSDSGK